MSPNRQPLRPTPRPLPRPRSAPPAPKSHPLLKRTNIIILILATVGSFIWFTIPRTEDQAKDSTNSSTPAFDKERYSVNNPASPWVVVNKKRPLDPIGYTPPALAAPNMPLRLGASNEEMQLSTAIIPDLEELVAAARQKDLQLMLASGYRSYDFQQNLYNGYVRAYGQTEANKTSARPGYSEHQTGLAVDLEPTTRQCEIEACFGDMPEGSWLAQNAWRYGFIIRYPKGAESLTGYEYEPWHLRYVGKELAAELHAQNTATLEEFFELPGGRNY